VWFECFVCFNTVLELLWSFWKPWETCAAIQQNSSQIRGFSSLRASSTQGRENFGENSEQEVAYECFILTDLWCLAIAYFMGFWNSSLRGILSGLYIFLDANYLSILFRSKDVNHFLINLGDVD